jgi:hypothetical protein
MADNVPITAGSGTNIGTDEVAVNGGSTVHVQYVKLVDGTANGTEGLPGTAANGMDVDVTRVIPGTTSTALGKAEDAAHTDGDVGVLMLGIRNHTGAGADGDYSGLSTTSTGELRTMSHRQTVRVQVTSGGLTTSVTAYTAGDQVGTQFTIAGAARLTGGTGRIVSVLLTDETDIIGAYDVVFSRSSITPAADNAAFTISDTDALAVVGVAQLAGSFDLGANRLAQYFGPPIPYDCSGGTSLYANLICRVGHAFFGATTSLKLTVFLELD